MRRPITLILTSDPLTERPNGRPALYCKLSGFYAAYFLAIGLHVAFWPLWLDSQGLSVVEIGWVLAAAFWIKIVAQPALAGLADRHGRTSRLTTVLMALATLGFCTLAGIREFWLLLVVVAVTAACYQPVLPIMESVALRHTEAARLDYGRIRLWGSVAFIVATIGGGWLLEDMQRHAIVWMIAAAMALIALACAWAPDRPGHFDRPARPGAWRILATPAMALFVVTAGLIHASHAVLYGFATLHWQQLGHGEAMIGLFWAVGVVAEIILFFCIGPALRRLNPVLLLALAALGGIIRWPLLAITADPVALLALQTLHGLTFGAGHLGAMMFLSRSVPPELSATGQGLYYMLVGGVIGGCMFPLAGLLYADLAANAFLVMGAVSAAGLFAAAVLQQLARRELT